MTTKAVALPLNQRAALKIEDAARFISVSASSIHRAINTGELRVSRVHGGPLILRHDLDAYLHNGYRAA